MASSTSSSSMKHDVFLSFRGEDTRRTFTSHLYAALCRKSIDTFIDDEEIERGDEISPTLLEAIERSKISIIIFSKDYASSKWCLDELVKIIECKNKMQHVVLPVFYNIDPSDVRKQSGVYADAFAKHEKHNQVKVQKWRRALEEAANLAGWDSSNTRLEAELVENVVNDVLQKLNHFINPEVPHSLVGVEKQITCIESLLCSESTDVRIVGIWGMGGIGKTTIADVLFKKLSAQFQSHAFVENVREKWAHLGKYELRNQLLRQILEDQTLHIETSSIRSTFIVDRLQRRKILIVLDDVSDFQQMNYLVEEKDWFGSGSRIIVTTRNKDVLPKENVRLHKVMPLNNNEALQLFCLKAFGQDSPKNEFKDLCNMVLDYAGGIPLAITVLGSLLRSKNQEEWKGTFQKLKKAPNANIHGVLRLSYEELDYQEKEIFLDIACFLKGEMKGHIIDILDGCRPSINIDLKNLHDKSLINISESEHVQMHDLIQEIGWHIVREESIKQPEKRSRLWDPEDIYLVLKCETGNDHSIESISLNMSQIKEVQMRPDTFAKMPRLRLLKFYMPNYLCKCNMNVSKGLECLPDHLRYLCWDYFPLNAMPSSFRAEMLVEIRLKYSPIKKLWDGDQDVANLKILWLPRCHDLLELPCLKKAAKLEEIDLAFCRSLLHIPSYILSLDNLSVLNLSECKQLQCIRSDRPSKSLRQLNLSGCSNLVEFSVDSENLGWLSLADTAIEELGFSIGLHTNLYYLYLRGCERLMKIPVMPNTAMSIQCICLQQCSKLSELPDSLSHLSTLVELDLGGSAIETLPASIKLLPHLTTLNVSNCERLRSLPELPPLLHSLDAISCISLENVPSIAPKAQMENCFGGKKMSLLPKQDQEPKTPIDCGFCPEWFNFTDCTKLDENACKTILDEAAIRIKHTTYVLSMVEASTDLCHQSYLFSEVFDIVPCHYTYCLMSFKYIANCYPDSTRIENGEFQFFTVNFNGISGGDLKRLVLALELNQEENMDADFDTSMQKICKQQGFPIPILRDVSKRWDRAVEVRLPGSRVPRWIRYKTTQTPFIITFQLPPSSHLLDFALCFVFKKVRVNTEHINCECEYYLEDGEGNKISESFDFSFYVINLFSDVVFVYHPGRFTRILEKLKEIRVTDQCSTVNSKLSFQFSFTSFSGKSIDRVKECGVWPIYASDLKSENPMESVELRVQPRRNKLKKRRNRNLLLLNCRWQALMKMSKRNGINLSSSSRIKGKMSKILDEQQHQLPPGKKFRRSRDIDELGGCSTIGIEKDELQPLHQTKRQKKEKRDAEK